MDQKELNRIIKNVVSVHSKMYREDLTQECWLYALAKEPYFVGTNEQWHKHLGKSLKGVCKNYLNPNRGDNRVIDSSDSVPLDETLYTEEGESFTQADNLPDEYNIDNHVESTFNLKDLRDKISDRDFEILELYYSGFTPKSMIENNLVKGLKSAAIYNVINKYKI